MTRDQSAQAMQRPSVALRAATGMSNAAHAIFARADKAVERLSARHEANEARLVAQRFVKLLTSDAHAPVLKPSPSFAGQGIDKKAWLMRAARYQIAREFEGRIARVRAVAKRMMAAQGVPRARDDLAR